MKKKRITKRARLIALLSALAALASGGIGAGAAFSAMAATKSSSVSSYASPSKGKKASLFEKGPKEQKLSPSQEKAVLANVSTANGAAIGHYFSSFPGNIFSSSLGVNGNLSSSLTGQSASGYIWVPEGVNLALFTTNFADPNGTYVNPNTLNREQLVKLMEGGGYVGAVDLVTSNGTIPLMGLVSSTGRPWTQSQIENSGISNTGTVQNEFMSKCMGYQWISAAPAGPKKDETVQLSASQGAAGIVADGVLGIATPSAVLPDIESGLKRMGYTGTAYDTALKAIQTVFTDSKVTSFQSAFMKWYNNKNSKDADTYLAEAVSAAQNLLKGDFGAQFKKELPMVCEAAWNGSVEFNEYENGSVVQTGAWQDLYTPGNDLNSGSSNPYVSNFAASGFGPDIAGCGQNTKGGQNAQECGITVNVDALGCAFIYDTFGTNLQVLASYFVSAQKSSSSSSLPDPAYSDPGAVVENSLTVTYNGGIDSAINNNDFIVRQTGTSPTLFNPTSVGSTFSPTLTPSSSGLWFKAIDQEGKPLKQVKVLLIPLSSTMKPVQSQIITNNIGGATPLNPYPWTGSSFKGDSYKGIGQLSSDLSSGSGVTPNADGGLIGYLWNGQSGATAANDYALIPLNQVSGQNGVFEISGLPFGVYRVDLVSGENQAGQTEEYGSYYTAPSFEVNLNSYNTSSEPEKMSAISDPCGFVDPSKDLVVVGSTNPSSAKVSGTSLSTSTFTATVGSSNPYTYQTEAYLPFDLSGQKNSLGTSASSTPLSFSLSVPGQSVVSGSVKVNGLALSSLSGSSSSVSGSTLTLSLTPQNISTIESKGEMPIGSSSGSLTQNGQVNHTLAITWEAYLTPSFTSSASSTFEFNYKAYAKVNPNDKTMALTPQVETNGPANNSVPSALAPTQNSSKTGIWFKSLWYNTSTPAPGSKYTVKNASGQYLTPVLSSGTFEGWSWTTSPYDFTEKDAASAVFSFGGLADGDYTLTQVSPATGATSSSLTFTSTLSYSSPQSLKAVKDSLNLLDASKDTVWAITVPSSLPLTGGKMVLIVSLSAVILFGAGALFFILRKRRRA